MIGRRLQDPAKPGGGLVKVGLSVEGVGKASWTFSQNIKNGPSELRSSLPPSLPPSTPPPVTLLHYPLLLVD